MPGDIVHGPSMGRRLSRLPTSCWTCVPEPSDTVTTVNSGGQEKEVQVTLGDDSASQKAKQEQQSQEQSMNGYSLEDLFGRQR